MPFFFCGLEHFENSNMTRRAMLKFQILGKLFALLAVFVIELLLNKKATRSNV